MRFARASYSYLVNICIFNTTVDLRVLSAYNMLLDVYTYEYHIRSIYTQGLPEYIWQNFMMYIHLFRSSFNLIMQLRPRPQSLAWSSNKYALRLFAYVSYIFTSFGVHMQIISKQVFSSCSGICTSMDLQTPWL